MKEMSVTFRWALYREMGCRDKVVLLPVMPQDSHRLDLSCAYFVFHPVFIFTLFC